MTVIRLAVPYRADGGHRDALWDHLRPQWLSRGLTPVEGFQHDEGPFNRAACVNEALAGPWDVAVIADADTMLDLPVLIAGIHWRLDPERLLLPYTERRMLDEDHTHRLLLRSRPGPWAGDVAAGAAEGHWTLDPYVGFRSGVIVVHRTLWDRVGGMDPRFLGWGAEDDAFADACETLGGGPPVRLDGPLWHLWHPDARPPRSDPHYRMNQRLWTRYRHAKGRPGVMAALVAEHPS